MTRDDARLAEMRHLTDAARALAEAQDASEIGGIEPRDLVVADRVALVAGLIVLGLAVWVALRLGGVL